MNHLIRIKFILGVILSFVFMFFDLIINTGNGLVMHLGPFIVGIIFVSAITSLIKDKNK